MAYQRLSRGVNIAFSGPSSQNTGLEVITAINVAVSGAATVSLRETSGGGTVVAQQVLAGAGQWSPQLPVDGVRCSSGTFFVEAGAGTLTGGVMGY